MTVPTPPDGKQPGDQTPDDHNPWSPPPPGPPSTRWEPYPMAPIPGSQARNGMGITALVLGIVGIVLGLLIILFWMSWLPALLAVIFGSVGLSHARTGRATNKAMALTGVILGGAGLLAALGGGIFTVTVVKKVADSARAKVKEVKASASASEKARHLSFGESYTFEDGLKVTVTKPEPFTPDDYVLGHAKGNKAVQVTVKVVNTGTERVKVDTGLPEVSDADGASSELVIDGSGRQKVITGYVLPGKEAVGKYAFSLPPDAADRIEVEFSPDAMRWDDAYWSGPTR
ncbi:DUF4352 domain-containing protein [Streptomyces sp. Je 1-4]|uniref:DUF4190 domain-containing protein n=1 Tax=Streptomyces TaxID=1883 RepID=UPI0021DB667F|nr:MULTISPECIES: DUF4190 domain-containing protein [unclassified Streptomyces]UYB38542.1 DUF4352 domain-containing protein [Streptomyces sp. Je 1-4]UZQ34505.1 DUF4352 domain-containing protein [Streptomyces sp. Je 1-4] [Streptomyces sp. Je 1-4 4N24]UZQ41923.1 DUF4352 domain-containing protein [Streptomyces sp. Je 1-4] [Streptomyces sp. Je 1-4 4N24_ara]